MKNYKMMGVINITPDSFSDGNQYNHFNSFKLKFDELLAWADIIDIGAESSAPMNSKVESSAEKKRFEEIFFPYIQSRPDPSINLSIDTYKTETFIFVYDFVKKFWPKTKLYFNDVSGQVDINLLTLLKSERDFFYILSHNLVEKRELTLKHMDYCLSINNDDFLKSMNQFFKERLQILKEYQDIIIIDPCFGFSKSREQNLFLINHFSKFLTSIDFKGEVAVGISKKSFLRPLSFSKSLNAMETSIIEQVHASILSKFLINNCDYKFIFRVHDEKIKATLDILNDISS